MGEPVFIFDGTDLVVCPTIDDAAGYLELVDVQNGEYDGFFTADGERLVARPVGEWNVALERSGDLASRELHDLLRAAHDRGAFAADPSDPHAVAREKLGMGSPLAEVASMVGPSLAR